ncbi:MAG: hydrolase TatD, partial [Chromatiales bacterium]|nr:hydrolase TatD [Chromatiales bacterium]
MPEALVDIGVNLAHDSFDHDRDEVVARARAAGVAPRVLTRPTGAPAVAAVGLGRPPGVEGVATARLHPP